MRAHLLHRSLTVLVTVSIGAGLMLAHAASLDVTANGYFAYSDHAAIAAPPIIGCDNFARPTVKGNQLAGRPVQLPSQCGSETWVINTGTWKITGGRADATGAHATATIGVGTTNASVEANFVNANVNGRVGGVTLAHSGGASPRYLAAVVAGPNGVQVRISNGATVTTVATGTSAFGSPVRLRATLLGGVVTVSVNGVLVLTHTLSAANLALLSGSTRAGLYDNQGSVKFDDFLVTQAWPP